MYQIIAPTLFQSKICRLPGIGTLKMTTVPAHTDFVNGQITAPEETIEFLQEPFGEKIFNEFSAIAELLKKTLDENGIAFLKGIGTFTRGADDNVEFIGVQIKPELTQNVTFERVIRENAQHAILVGDQETTNVQMTEFFTEKPTLKYNWKIAAMILGAVGVAALTYYLSKYGFNAFGNSSGL
ncbi:hypothetical protein BH11BAC3_BH11BAC3_34680 [soil metagenome]